MDARKIKEKAQEAFSKGKFAKAAEAYAQFCDADKTDLHARLRMGDAWSKAGQKEKAIGAYSWAAEGFAKDGFLPRAIAASKLILELDPAHKGVQKMLADLYARKNQPAPKRTGASQGLGSAPAAAPPAPAPIAPAAPEAPSPMNRADAIDLPPEEIAIETETTTDAKQRRGFEVRDDGITLETDGSDRPGEKAALADEAIELDVATVGAPPPKVESAEVEIAVEGTELPPEPPAPVAPAPPKPALEALDPVPPPRAPAVVAPPGGVYELDVGDEETLDSYAASLKSVPAPAASAPLDLVVEIDPMEAVAAVPRASPSAPPGLKPRRASEAAPDAPAPATADASAEGRIWLPPGFEPPAVAPAFTPAPPAPIAPSASSLHEPSTDLERSLAAFSAFDVDAAPPRVTALPSVAPSIKPAAAPPPPPPAPAHAVFTELDLDGDSLLHAVEAAANTGAQARGEIAHHPGEELMEAPEPDLPAAGALPKIPLFSDLPEDAFIALFERCPLKRCEPGDLVVNQGTQGNALYVICAGSVKVFRTDHGRRKDLVTLEEGAFFGEMALLSDAPRSASVEAASPDTQLLEISAPVLSDLSRQHPQVSTALKKFCRQRMLSNVMATAALFEPFSKSDRRDLVQKFRSRDVKKGEVVIREGQRSDGMYVILSGEVEVTVGGAKVASLKEGEVFGEMSLLTKAPAAGSVTAGRRTSLLRLPREDFDMLILSHPQILVLVSDLTDERKRLNAALPRTEPGSSGAAPMV